MGTPAFTFGERIPGETFETPNPSHRTARKNQNTHYRALAALRCPPHPSQRLLDDACGGEVLLPRRFVPPAIYPTRFHHVRLCCRQPCVETHRTASDAAARGTARYLHYGRDFLHVCGTRHDAKYVRQYRASVSVCD